MNQENQHLPGSHPVRCGADRLLTHIEARWEPGTLPWAKHLGSEAVAVFFVLSGFVIAHTTPTTETSVTVTGPARALALIILVLPLPLMLAAVTERRKASWRRAFERLARLDRASSGPYLPGDNRLRPQVFSSD
jgi:hypothetical protein